MEEIKKEIPFNYFLIMFHKELNRRVHNLILDEREEVLSGEEQIKVFNASFYEILTKYLVLSNNQSIVVRPEEPVALFGLILSDIKDNPYKESLLKSVQFIMVRYLEMLGKGYPIIMFGDNPEKEKSFRVVYDSKQRINTFDSTNMTLEEQSDTMLKILKNALENKEDEIPYVNYVTRTDI